MFYGGLVGVFSAILVSRLFMKFPLGIPLDFTAIVLPLGLAIQRIGCFLRGCCYGVSTNSFLGVTFPGMKHAVHPTQLYEIVFSLFLFIALLNIRKRLYFPGFIFALLLVIYGVYRYFIEFIRPDILLPGYHPFTASQAISLILIVIGTIIIFVKRKELKKPAPGTF